MRRDVKQLYVQSSCIVRADAKYMDHLVCFRNRLQEIRNVSQGSVRITPQQEFTGIEKTRN
jgi:hypothetical protein